MPHIDQPVHPMVYCLESTTLMSWMTHDFLMLLGWSVEHQLRSLAQAGSGSDRSQVITSLPCIISWTQPASPSAPCMPSFWTC